VNKRIKVWDLSTRLFHWVLLCAVSYSWFSIEILENMQQHFYAGYTVLTALLFRLVWGVIGSTHSRFRSFIYSPREILEYLSSLKNTRPSVYLGHNPLGSLSVIAILILLLAQVILGLFSTDGYFFGPLSGLVSDDLRQALTSLHLDNTNLIYAMLALHVMAIAYYKVRKQEPLTKAMFSGYKEIGDVSQPEPHNHLASNTLALAVLVCCAAFVYWLVNAYVDITPAGEYDYY